MADRNEDYTAAGFGQSLPFGERPALIVIDFAMAYLVKESPLYAGVESELAVTRDLVAAVRNADVPVIWTRVEYDPALEGRDGGMFRRKIAALSCFDRGNPLADFDPSLSPEPGDMVVTKRYPSAFFATHLAATLTAMRMDTLIITGLSTSGCVRATAVDALCHGFAPFIVEDACGDRDRAVHDASIFDLKAKTAEVVDCDWMKARIG
ncbi:MAG: isochorismatase family protein [Pacificimonas sp.]